MYDAFLLYSNNPWNKKNFININGDYVELPARYYYMTCHRQENTYDDNTLNEILMAMNSLEYPTVYSVHPRNRERAKNLCKSKGYRNIILIDPVGYNDSIHLLKNAEKVVTDSGGLQCEAFFAEVQCVTILNQVSWMETLVDNRNQLSRPNHKEIVEKLNMVQKVDCNYKPFGDGNTAQKIVEIINQWERQNR